jgi:hypothetical protein
MELNDLQRQMLSAAYEADYRRETINFNSWADENQLDRGPVWNAYEDLKKAGWLRSIAIGGTVELTGSGAFQAEKAGLVDTDTVAENERIRTRISIELATRREVGGWHSGMQFAELQQTLSDIEPRKLNFNVSTLLDLSIIIADGPFLEPSNEMLEAVADYRLREKIEKTVDEAKDGTIEQRAVAIRSAWTMIMNDAGWTRVRDDGERTVYQAGGQYYLTEVHWLDAPLAMDTFRAHRSIIQSNSTCRGLLFSWTGYGQDVLELTRKMVSAVPVVLLDENDFTAIIKRTASLDDRVTAALSRTLAESQIRTGGSPMVARIGFPFDEIDLTPTDDKVFVAHPFRQPFRTADFRPALEAALSSLGLHAEYADYDITSGHILGKVCRLIQECRFGIYDVSLWNPNVTLEWGLAVGLKRPTLLIVDSVHSEDVPADLSGFDRIQYTSFNDLKDKLTRTLPGFIGKL